MVRQSSLKWLFKGSNPFNPIFKNLIGLFGENGRRDGFKIRFSLEIVGSSPIIGKIAFLWIKINLKFYLIFFM